MSIRVSLLIVSKYFVVVVFVIGTNPEKGQIPNWQNKLEENCKFPLYFNYVDTVDECEEEGICNHQNCINKLGSYKCTCDGLDNGKIVNLITKIRSKYCF